MSGLRAAERPLVELHDALLVDLDGVVYTGERAVPGAAEALGQVRASGVAVVFVTNNASRTPDQVARHLAEVGVAADASDIVTSAQAAARLVADLVPEGAAVLVVGGEGLVYALEERGLHGVWSADDAPAAVVQGFHPDVGWRMLAEGALAVARGVPWVASNTDRTLPTLRGVAPGNGTLVEVLRSTTGASPEVAGKPYPPLLEEAARRTSASRPLVVGDRLDTDIEGAHRAGDDSLLVLTGISSAADLLAAPPHQRPSYVGLDMGALLRPHPGVVGTADGWCCRGWRATRGSRRLDLSGDGDPEDGLRALAAAAWSGDPLGVDAQNSREALARLGL